MSHYALINKNNIVEQIIVCDIDPVNFDFLNQIAIDISGRWIQTSYNTRAGVHYGQDGTPDGGIPLRKNYAGIGYSYSDELDAFIPPSPGKEWVLDTSTGLWILPSELLAEGTTPVAFIPTTYYNYNYTTKSSSGISIFFGSHLPPQTGFETVWSRVATDLGLVVSSTPTTFNLALTDEFANANSDSMEGLIPSATLMKLTDRISQQQLGIPVLPAIIPKSDSDLDFFGNVPIFIKPRRTYGKSNNKFAYTTWNTPNDFRTAIINDDFWQYQAIPDTVQGEFVMSPAIEHPLLDHIVTFAINSQSEVLFLKTQPGINNTSREYGDLESYPTVDPEIQTYIRKVCSDLSIRSGVHDVEFVEYNGSLKLMDWNVRPVYATTLGRDLKTGIMHAALAHMVGIPVDEISPFYTVQRSYFHLNIPWKICLEAQTRGIFSRRKGIYLYTLSYTGSSKTEATEVLDTFERDYGITR